MQLHVADSLLVLIGEHQPITTHQLTRKTWESKTEIDLSSSLGSLFADGLIAADGDLQAVATKFSRTAKGSARLPIQHQFVDQQLWAQALKECGGVAELGPTLATIHQTCRYSDVESMRANVLVLCRYLQLQGRSGTPRSVNGGVYQETFHHGDLIVDGDFHFGIPDDGDIVIVTGDLVISGLSLATRSRGDWLWAETWTAEQSLLTLRSPLVAVFPPSTHDLVGMTVPWCLESCAQ